jgi:predicted RNA-binding Zn ribbon-like protein
LARSQVQAEVLVIGAGAAGLAAARSEAANDIRTTHCVLKVTTMEITTTEPALTYQFVAGNLALDYANTADWHEAEHPVEMLTSYSDLLRWGQQAGLLDDGDVSRLLRAAEDDPEAAVTTYARAITLREALFRIFRSIARQQPASADDLRLLNDELARAFSHRQIVAGLDGYELKWRGRETALDGVLWTVAEAAADLLTEAELRRIRQCAGDPCGWLFYDTSRNRRRRWCSMEGCGNRAKARRYYERRRDSQKTASSP